MLETIPTYRMTLQPESFLPERNPGKSFADLACELPNTGNINRKQDMSFLPVEKHEAYYLSHLLLETKRFCREMLNNCSISLESHEPILRGNNWNEIAGLIETYQLLFFKYLLAHDLEQYKLFKGYLKDDIKGSRNVEEIRLHLRKYVVMSKLYRKVNEDYQRLKAIYC